MTLPTIQFMYRRRAYVVTSMVHVEHQKSVVMLRFLFEDIFWVMVAIILSKGDAYLIALIDKPLFLDSMHQCIHVCWTEEIDTV